MSGKVLEIEMKKHKTRRKKTSKNIVIIGAQWGDEGKAKMVDVLTEQVDIVARYQGGSNAGRLSRAAKSLYFTKYLLAFCTQTKSALLVMELF